MTPEKILDVITIYEKKLEHYELRKFPHKEMRPEGVQALNHCRTMLKQMRLFVKKKRIDKAFRWLGFVQGCLWSSGIYSLDELKNHNRP